MEKKEKKGRGKNEWWTFGGSGGGERKQTREIDFFNAEWKSGFPAEAVAAAPTKTPSSMRRKKEKRSYEELYFLVKENTKKNAFPARKKGEN